MTFARTGVEPGVEACFALGVFRRRTTVVSNAAVAGIRASSHPPRHKHPYLVHQAHPRRIVEDIDETASRRG